MKHFFTIEGTFDHVDNLFRFDKSIREQFKEFNLKHSTDCTMCNGTGEVGAKGIYMECVECNGGTRV